jgi:hypothetical protein
MSQNNDQASAPLEEVVLSQSFIIQTMINLLEQKGLLTREEILQEFQRIQEAKPGCDCGEEHYH